MEDYINGSLLIKKTFPFNFFDIVDIGSFIYYKKDDDDIFYYNKRRNFWNGFEIVFSKTFYIKKQLEMVWKWLYY